MPVIRVSRSGMVAAPAEVVYGILADYQHGHPSILPPEYFGPLEVEAGGRGAGTRIRFEMKAFGRSNVARASITEPVPGRELRETLDSGIVTTFLVEASGPRGTRVTITTSYTKPGIRGFVERLLAPAFLGKVYAAELAQLARVAEAAAGEPG